MKKRLINPIIILFLIIFTAYLTSAITGDTITTGAITGETITGKASNQGTNVSIQVIAVNPVLTLITPKNGTYITNESLLLNYTALNADEVWYNLDDLDNTTITSYIYFNASEGSHTLNLYVNNSQLGNANISVTFEVNSTQFTIEYNNFAGSGSSTDFNSYSYEELENLSNIILEQTSYGKISFLEAINLTDDSNPADNQVALDDFINISFNRIEINTTELLNFNKSAILELADLTFTTPRILIDGEVCPASICTENSYLGGTLSFNVTGFSVYSAEEAPVSASPPGGGTTGGGGGGTATITKAFSVNPEKKTISLKQGETKKESLIITNTGTQKSKFSISTEKIDNFLIISEKEFELEAGKSKTINLDFLAREEEIADLYIGKLIVQSGSLKKEILISIEVESKNPLFDAKIKITEKFQKIIPGEDLVAEVTLYSLGKTGQVDVKIDYAIKNEAGETIKSEQETLAVETQASFIKTFKIPENAKYGNYIIYLKATYDGQSASASAWFTVGKAVFLKTEYLIIIAIITITLIIMLVILYEIRKIKKHMKIDEKSLIKYKLVKRR